MSKGVSLDRALSFGFSLHFLFRTVINKGAIVVFSVTHRIMAFFMRFLKIGEKIKSFKCGYNK